MAQSGLFDREYFESQIGERFATDEQAIRDFLSSSPAKAYTFHPLVEGAWIDGILSEEMRPWHALFFESRALVSSGPLFRRNLGRPGSESETLATVMTRWRKSVVDSASLEVNPIHGRPLRLAQARDQLIELASSTGAQERRAARRYEATWNSVAEADYVRDLDAQSTRSGPWPNSSGSVPVVSVILPVFNRENALEPAIQSVINQTFESWELIVIDDGSTDASAAAIKKLAGTDDRIRHIRVQRGGVSAARNTGLSLARGEYVAFLDSDNEWTPDFLRVSLLAISAHGVAATFSAVDRLLDGDIHEYLCGPVDREQLIDGRNFVDLNALVLHRDVIAAVGEFDTSLRRWVDYDLVLRILRTYQLLYVPILGVRYDHRASSPGRITVTESPLWRDVVVERNLVNWDDLAAKLPGRRSERMSVLLRSRRNWQETLVTVSSLLDRSAQADVEIVIVDNGSPRSDAAILTAAFLGDERVLVRRAASDLHLPTSVNFAFSMSTGRELVVVEPGAVIAEGWVDQVHKAIDHSAEGIFVGPTASLAGVLLAATAESFVSRRGLEPMPAVDQVAGPPAEQLRMRATPITNG